MKTYRVQITGDRFPTEYIVQASGWATGVARAIKEWKTKFKGSKTAKLRIVAMKGGEILKTNEKE